MTGIDIDGRIGMLTKAAECMQKEIVSYISFVKSIPGWENVHNSDKLTLIKGRLDNRKQKGMNYNQQRYRFCIVDFG